MIPPKCHVLCVDDHDDTCLMLNSLLRQQGYEVTTAASVAAAESAVRRARFDLAILDNRISDGAGTDLCGWVREQAPGTPIIFYSAAAYQSDRDEGMYAGASAYVIKPDIEGLLTAISELLMDRECAAANTN